MELDTYTGPLWPNQGRRGNTGTYVGRFKRPRTDRRATKAERYGFVGQSERYGTVTGTDVAYIGVTTVHPKEWFFAVAVALLRDIIKTHAGIDVSSIDHRIDWDVGTSTGGGDPVFRGIEWVPKYYDYNAQTSSFITNGTTNAPSVGQSYVMTLNDTTNTTLTDLAIELVENVFCSAAFGGKVDSNFGSYELAGYRIIRSDRTSTTTVAERYFSPTYYFDKWYLSLNIRRVLSVQNATPADTADGNAVNVDRIDRNPIRGRMFKFSCPYPRLNIPDYAASDIVPVFQDTLQDAVLIPSFDNVTNYGRWKQVPTTAYFDRVSGVAEVAMEPGHIKDFAIYRTVTCTIPDLMRWCAVSTHTGATTQVVPRYFGNDELGPCVLLALEKRMSTGSNSVVLNFQMDSHVTAYMHKRPTQRYIQTANAGTTAASLYDTRPVPIP